MGYFTRPGLKASDGASVGVRYPSFLDGADRLGAREIHSLHTDIDKRRRGHATALMSRVLAAMDRENLVAILVVGPYGVETTDRMDAAALAEWYARGFGFMTIQRQPAWMMARIPGAKPLPEIMRQPVVAIEDNA